MAEYRRKKKKICQMCAGKSVDYKDVMIINKYINELGIPFIMGVGGSFDIVAGITVRAPKWMQNHGLEWLYRFIQEPKRMWKRYIIGNIKFILLIHKARKGK